MANKKKAKAKPKKAVEPKTPPGIVFCMHGMCWAVFLALFGGLTLFIGYLSSEGVEVEVPCFDKHNNLIKDVVCSETQLTLDNEISDSGFQIMMSAMVLFMLAFMFMVIVATTATDGEK